MFFALASWLKEWFRTLAVLLCLSVWASAQTPPTTVYLDSTQFTQIANNQAATLQAAQDFLTVANSQTANQASALSTLNAYLAATSGSLNNSSASLASATTAFVSAAAAMNNGNWAALNNNLVAFNSNVSDYRSTLFQHYSGLTNALRAIPGDMANVINTALAGVMAANSNLASSTNLANLAGLAALTNLSSVIVLTNITDQLQQVNSNLLTMTNFGLSTETMLDMAETIGGAVSNAQTISGIMLSNAVVVNGEIQRQFDASLTNWPFRTFTNGQYLAHLAGQITNELALLGQQFDFANGTLSGISNGVAALEGQGIIAGLRRDEIRDALRDLVGIQRTNTPQLGVTVTNSPTGPPGSGAVIDGQLEGKTEVGDARPGVAGGNFIGQAAAIGNPFALGESVPTYAPSTLGAEPNMVMSFPKPGGGNWQIDANPMHHASFGPMIVAFRTALAWGCTVAFLVFCAARAREASAQVTSTPQIAVPNLTILGNNVGAAAAPVFVGLYVAAAVVFCAAITAVIQPGGLSSALGVDPLAGFSSGALWLADQCLPLALMVGQALWALTASYTLMAAAWSFTLMQKLLVR